MTHGPAGQPAPIHDPMFTFPPSRVTAGVAVGGFVRDYPPGTNAVLCLALPSEVDWARSHGYRGPAAALKDFAWMPTPDSGKSPPAANWLADAVAVLIAWRNRGWRAYVHCAAGWSRSPTVVAGYLVRRYEWDAAQALDFVRHSRPIVRPNPALLRCLADYAGTPVPVLPPLDLNSELAAQAARTAVYAQTQAVA